MTELADRLSRHADLHEHQPWADDEQMQFARDLREAVGLIAELARLRAQVPVGWIGPSGFTHNTATNRMWMRESPKLAAKLSPVYAAPPAQPAEPVQRLSDERIMHFWDIHVGMPTEKYPLNYKDIRVFARAIESALQPGWRDIESAPKDGTHVLLWCQTHIQKGVQAMPFTGRWFSGGPWIIVNADMAIQRVEPTHWMALPPAPKATK